MELNANVMGIWENIFPAKKKERKHVADVPKLLESAVNSRIFVDLSTYTGKVRKEQPCTAAESLRFHSDTLRVHFANLQSKALSISLNIQLDSTTNQLPSTCEETRTQLLPSSIKSPRNKLRRKMNKEQH